MKKPAEEVIIDSEPEDAHLQAIGGLSEGDDSLEKEDAMCSPLKGTDLHGSVKVSS